MTSAATPLGRTPSEPEPAPARALRGAAPRRGPAVAILAAIGPGAAVGLLLVAGVASGPGVLWLLAGMVAGGGIAAVVMAGRAAKEREARDDVVRSQDLVHERERAVEGSRGELLAMLTQDLRGPLATIRVAAEALEDGVIDAPEDLERYHKSLRIEADRLTVLLDDLYELSRTGAPILATELVPASLHALVTDAITETTPMARAKGVAIASSADGAAPVLALAEREMARALRSMVETAIRHTPTDGAITVTTGVHDAIAYVSVDDACGGRVAADLSRAFDTAFRAPSPSGSVSTPATEDSGRGLALAIARQIVAAHRGTIELHRIDAGCRLLLQLPLQAGA